jgi:hypothetical protein
MQIDSLGFIGAAGMGLGGALCLTLLFIGFWEQR